MRKVATDVNDVTLLELPKFSDDCFRSIDWLHLSINGIHKMGETVANLLSSRIKIS